MFGYHEIMKGTREGECLSLFDQTTLSPDRTAFLNAWRYDVIMHSGTYNHQPSGTFENVFKTASMGNILQDTIAEPLHEHAQCFGSESALEKKEAIAVHKLNAPNWTPSSVIRSAIRARSIACD